METAVAPVGTPFRVWVSCLRKKRYGHKKDARMALLQCWRRGRSERSFYPCEYCGCFHLTKQEPGEGSREI